MKNSFKFFVLFMFVSLSMAGQVVEIVSGLLGPGHMAIKDNMLYYADGTWYSQEGTIHKIDITDPNATPIEVLSNLYQPFGVLLLGEELLYGDIYETDVFKFDTNDPNPQPTVFADLVKPETMVRYNDQVLISDFDLDGIYSVDLTDPNATATLMVPNILQPTGMCLVDDYLYVCLPQQSKIIRIDLSDPTYPSEDVLTGWCNDIERVGAELYISGGTVIKKINLYDSNPIPEVVVSGLSAPWALLYHDNELYFTDYNFGTISKIVLTLGTNDQIVTTDLSIFPNPSSNEIHVMGLTQTEAYNIYTINGLLISQGIVRADEPINISNLSSGLYFLTLQNGAKLKLMKE